MTTTYHAFYSDGRQVQVGDDLTNFRGESGYKFVSASPSRGSGHVQVTTPDGGSRQFYPRVFGLQEPIMADDEEGPRPIYKIADEITREWKNVYFGAVPYLGAMRVLRTIDDQFDQDSAKDVILYFLSNAAYWRGSVAKRIKAELKELIK
jgi:hypothetical protein